MNVKSGISLIFLPTLKCNADCDYCFEQKTGAVMSIDQFKIMLDKLLEYMEIHNMEGLRIFWQGGEVLTMEPDWLRRAHEITKTAAEKTGRVILNQLQTNLVSYGPQWTSIIKEMFDGQLGSSLDYPNLFRKLPGGTTEEYTRLWRKNYELARSNDISVGVISLPNDETFKIGPEAYYSYYFDEIGLTGLQVNSPFPGGDPNAVKKLFPLGVEAYSEFIVKLLDVWLQRGYFEGKGLSPYSGILHYFISGERGGLVCGNKPNCNEDFFSIDPYGNVSQCDCWVSSYPEFRYGNIFNDPSFDAIMKSAARKRLRDRPTVLISETDCIDCRHLSVCHGGCAIRAYTTFGTLAAKDPYCTAMKNVFDYLQSAALKIGPDMESPEPERCAG
jgi:uncharacterized protein